MKDVYSHIINIAVDCGKGFVYLRSYDDLYYYGYGEIPNNKIEVFDNQETVFDDLVSIVKWHCDVRKTFLTKKEYAYFPIIRTNIYRDKLKAFQVLHMYIKHNRVPLEILSKELPNDKFLDYIFDKKIELIQDKL